MTGAVDRSSPLPLWAQVLADLRRRLDAGEFAEQFPTEFEVVDQYGVSRTTVREALRRLQSEGLVLRERGRGTQVRTGRVEPHVGTLPQLFAAIRTGLGPVTSTIIRQERVVDDHQAARLGLGAGTPIVVIERVRSAAGEPIALDTAWVPWSVGAPLVDIDFEHAVLADELVRLGLRVDAVAERISATLTTATQRRLLQLPRPCPLLLVSTTSTGGGKVVEVRDVAFRGDRFALTAGWAGGRPASFDAIAVNATPLSVP